MVLGIIGGVLCILLGLFLLFTGVIFINPEIWQNIYKTTEAERQFVPDS